MLQLPNELLFRIADFTCKADLPSLRATCKHLEQLTRKRFAAAYITADRSPASFTGLDQLDHIVSHPYSSAVIQGWMAVGDVPVHSGFEGFETPLLSNPGWHLDFEDILFRTHSDRLFRTHNDRNLFVHHLQKALLHWSQGLHSCRLTNLRSYENGSKLIKDFEATGIDNIREHTQSRDFLEFESEEDNIDE
ncbi:hypothetical protein D6C95_03619 [Aureobasidium pullulans]|nr:hypothetical protein D6C95_03619 [Aureobasidium pullulans]